MAIDDSPQEFPRILIDSYFFCNPRKGNKLIVINVEVSVSFLHKVVLPVNLATTEPGSCLCWWFWCCPCPRTLCQSNAFPVEPHPRLFLHSFFDSPHKSHGLTSSLVDIGRLYFWKAQEGWTLQLFIYCALNFKCSLRFPGLWLRELFLFNAHSEPADTRWKCSETGTDGTALNARFCAIPVIVRTLLGGCSCCSAKLPLLDLGLLVWWFTCAAVAS